MDPWKKVDQLRAQNRMLKGVVALVVVWGLVMWVLVALAMRDGCV